MNVATLTFHCDERRRFRSHVPFLRILIFVLLSPLKLCRCYFVQPCIYVFFIKIPWEFRLEGHLICFSSSTFIHFTHYRSYVGSLNFQVVLSKLASSGYVCDVYSGCPWFELEGDIDYPELCFRYFHQFLQVNSGLIFVISQT